jgi:hypothetical protein
MYSRAEEWRERFGSGNVTADNYTGTLLHPAVKKAASRDFSKKKYQELSVF